MSSPVAPLTFRPAGPADLPGLLGWTTAEPVSWVPAGRFRAELATGNYRDAWTWLAERAGRPVGRALWWGPTGARHPATLDCLLVAASEERPDEVGAGLITAAHAAFGNGTPEYIVDLAVGWSDDPAAVRAAGWRRRAAAGAGLTRVTERISFARADTDPLPERSRRVRFAAATDTEFRQLFGAVAAGSLDAHTLDMVARHGVDELARDDLEFYLSLPGRREAWQIAVRTDGVTVGFVIPTRTAYDASISYLGVLPAHRGQGYVHDLLAEMVHVHHDDGQARIVGTTDAANLPMRAAFARAGFGVTRVRMVHAR